MRWLLILIILTTPVNAGDSKLGAAKPLKRDPRICRANQHIKNILENRYRERFVFQGVGSGSKYVTRLYVNRTTGTWSVVLFYPNGIACIDNTGLLGETTFGNYPSAPS